MNFPIRSRCVLKALIHRKKQWIVLRYLRKFFFFFFFSRRHFLYCTGMLYLINFSILSRSVSIFDVSLSINYQLHDLILRLHILFL